MIRPQATHAHRFIVLAVLAVLVLVVYFETVRSMVDIWWRSETFTHAFLVPPIVGWLCWRQWPMLRYVPTGSGSLALVPMAMSGAAWFLGDLVAVNTVTQLAVVSMLVLLVPLVFGWAWTKALLFPLAFFYFCVPFGEFAMPRLMAWTADFTVQALRFSGVPVFREGLQFVIPTGTWSVVEACSGIRYIIASLTVGTLFAYLNYQSARKRLIFIGVAFLVPIVANWVRAYLIVMLGHVSGNKLAAGVDHLIYGWVFFGAVIMLMFMIGSKWSDTDEKHEAHGAEAKTLPQTSGTGPIDFWVISGAGLFALLMPWMATVALDGLNSKARVEFSDQAQFSGAWREVKESELNWSPDFKNPSAKKIWQFEKAGQKVGAYIAYYRNQSTTRKLVSSENVLIRSGDPNWARIMSSRKEIQVGTQTLPIQYSVLRAGALGEGKDAVRMHVYQMYWVNRTWMASDIQAKIAGAVSQLRGDGDDSAVLVLYAMSRADQDSRQVLDEFLQDQLAPLEGILANIALSGRAH